MLFTKYISALLSSYRSSYCLQFFTTRKFLFRIDGYYETSKSYKKITGDFLAFRNNHALRNLNEIKTLLINASKATNRTQSTLHNQIIEIAKRVNQCQLKSKKNNIDHL
jgi:hypothetical protein